MLRLVAILCLLAAPVLSEVSTETPPEPQLPNENDGNLNTTRHVVEKNNGDDLQKKSVGVDPEENKVIRETQTAKHEHQKHLHAAHKISTYVNTTTNLGYYCSPGFKVFADPDGNCSVYYVCHDRYAERKTCKGRLHFNALTKLCDYPANAACDIKCPRTGIDRLYLPGECNMYVDCKAGVRKYMKCPEGMHYNAVTKMCDSPANAACNIKCPHYDTFVMLPGRCNMYTRCEKGTATIQLCPKGLYFNPMKLQCEIREKEDCLPECLKPNGYFPVLGQCGSYIKCKNNVPKVHSCPSGLHFNFLLQNCDIPSENGCEFKCKKPFGFFPFPGVCSYYFRCSYGIPYLQRCKGGREFNPDVNQCDHTVKDSCLPSCPERNGIFPVVKDCQHYIRCKDGFGLVKKCPPGLHYNALFEYCDLPERAKCVPECPYPFGMFPLPGRCNEYYICENDRTYLRLCGQGLHYNAWTQTCEFPATAHCKVTCPKEETFYPIQGDCNAYVHCRDGHAIRKKCPEGKEFNIFSETCKYPENSDCEQAGYQEVGALGIPLVFRKAVI